MATNINNAAENSSATVAEMEATNVDDQLENDETVDAGPPGFKPYYICREYEPNVERVRLLQKLEQVIKERVASDSKEKVGYIRVEGSYFPDLLVEDGYYLVSVPLLAYLEYKFTAVAVASYRIALVGEDGKRIEEYALLLPEELDCIVTESVVYNDQQVLDFFELDPVKVAGAEIFKVKGFPHLVVAAKFNRIEFAGLQCVRIDRYFDYAARQVRLRQEQLEAEQPERVLQRMEAVATGRDSVCVREFKKMLNRRAFESDFNLGFVQILESFHHNSRFGQEFGSNCLELVWSWKREVCQLTRDCEFFGKTGFEFCYLADLKEVWAQLPEPLRPDGCKLCFQAVNAAASQALAAMFPRFDHIHHHSRFRFYLREAAENDGEPLLIYEFAGQAPVKQTVRESLREEWSNRDLRETDFKGKNLDGLQISDSNLSRVKFHGSQLNRTEFLNCDLTGVEFAKASMVGVKFIDCRLDRAGFEQAELKEAVIAGCSLEHTRFTQSNLTGVELNADGLFGTFFYRSRLIRAVFNIPGALTGCVFRLCDLRQAQFNGDKQVFDNNLEDCDFRNADLSDCQIATRGVARCLFVKAKLVCADFSRCKEIIDCDFRWTNCNGMNLEGVWVLNNNFTFVDLSRIAPKKGVIFKDNDFSYTNLTGYDFSGMDFSFPNRLVYTDLSNCQFQGYDLSSSYILYANFKDANLQEAVFTEKQLLHLKLSSRQQSEIIQDSDDDENEDEDE
jgi:uncharacterized protein YjbI with pentapeptide repeats